MAGSAQKWQEVVGVALTIGDALFAVLCACGHNIRKILAHIRVWLALILAAILAAQIAQDRPLLANATA